MTDNATNDNGNIATASSDAIWAEIDSYELASV